MHPPITGMIESMDHDDFAVDQDVTAGSTALLRDAVSSAACQICGRRPLPPRLRHTLAKLGAVVPAEVALHAIVLHYHLSYLLTVLLLVLGTSLLVICVVEPSTMRVLRTWLHAPHEHRQRQVNAGLALWRLRLTVEDEPGSLERITHALAQLEANILCIKVHPMEEGVLDEIVVATDVDLRPGSLSDSMASAGGRDIEVDPTTPLALVDVETRALDLAGRVAANPEALPQAVATLLDARLVTDRARLSVHPPSADGAAVTTLRIPSPWTAPLLFSRPGRPFTPAESARAHGLAAIAARAAGQL